MDPNRDVQQFWDSHKLPYLLEMHRAISLDIPAFRWDSEMRMVLSDATRGSADEELRIVADALRHELVTRSETDAMRFLSEFKRRCALYREIPGRLREIIERANALETKETVSEENSAEPIHWVGSQAQLIYLIHQLRYSLNLISNSNLWKDAEAHFRVRGRRVKAANLATEANSIFGTGRKVRRSEAIDSLLDGLKTESESESEES